MRGAVSTSKAAVESISEALREELAPLGVRVSIVEPGSFRAEFLSADSRRIANNALPDFDGTAGALLRGIEVNNGKQPGDPTKAAAAIRRLAELADPPLRLQLGSDCVKLVEAKLASVGDELKLWRDVALPTGYPVS
ncbi:SDR family NAD(P)-dependent oxidoreductase [Streptomyces misionensis]|uniref:SDR family NAD(P)-dependent oxidoreductase n=1 Tax=Streptomyces misionensis TaxID=67331 RepID=UPI0033ED45B5